MKYLENDFYPAWLPLQYRSIIDLSELAEPNEQIITEANMLMKKLGVNIAIYKGLNFTSKKIPAGLCSVFKSAVLQNDQLDFLFNVERRLKIYTIVAYTNPLQHHT